MKLFIYRRDALPCGICIKKNPLSRVCSLFLYFLVHFALAGVWVVFFELNFTLYLLTVFAGKAHMVRLRGLELDKVVL